MAYSTCGIYILELVFYLYIYFNLSCLIAYKLSTFLTFCLVVTQEYNTYVNQGQVIRGNDVIMKCDIPSFVADLLDIVHWVDNENNLYSNLMTNMGKTLYSGTPGIKWFSQLQ